MRALWKQDTPLDPTFAAVNRCLEQDWFLFPHELELQRAHAKALVGAGILATGEGRSIEDALTAMRAEFTGGRRPESDAEDLHSWVEHQLTERAGDAGRKIHTARSRNDQVATLLKLYVIAEGDAQAAALRSLAEAFGRRALDWSDWIFPLQTHTQFAAPGSVGFWALRYAVAFDRCARRMAASILEWRRFCPLGSGAVAGSSIPIDRRIQARELSFEAPSTNALDSTTTRDECLESLALAAQIALHLQSFATDVIAFSQTPFGWIVYPEAFATGSSMMPNKVNPDAMELLRGECAIVASAHGQAILLLKGLPSGYNRDLQCLKPVVRDAAERLKTMIDMTARFVRHLDFRPDRLAGSLELGNIGATLTMEQKVKEGMTLRQAHHAVAEEVRRGTADRPSAGVADASAYKTIGSASPAETRRIAEEMLRGIQKG